MSKKVLITVCFIAMSMIFSSCDKNEQTEQALDNSTCQKTKAFLNYDFGNSYKESMKDNKPTILVFYVNWCTYCRRLMPKLASVNNQYKNSYNIVLIDCEDKKNVDLLNKYKVEYYPTLYFVNKKDKQETIIPSKYTQNLETFKLFLDKNLQ